MLSTYMECPLQAEPLLDGGGGGGGGFVGDEDVLIHGRAPNIFPFIYFIFLN